MNDVVKPFLKLNETSLNTARDLDCRKSLNEATRVLVRPPNQSKH